MTHMLLQLSAPRRLRPRDDIWENHPYPSVPGMYVAREVVHAGGSGSHRSPSRAQSLISTGSSCHPLYQLTGETGHGPWNWC